MNWDELEWIGMDWDEMGLFGMDWDESGCIMQGKFEQIGMNTGFGIS